MTHFNNNKDMKDEQDFKALLNEVRVNNAVVVVGAGISFEPGMPLGNQLAPTVWEVVRSFPDIDKKFEGVGSTKNRIGEDFENIKKAFSYIEENEEALTMFKLIFKNINDKIDIAPEIHKNIARLVHEKFFELIVSFNWDSLLEMSWSKLYGTHINANKIALIKPHGDVLDKKRSWVLPNSPGKVSVEEKSYINQLATERPRTLIIVGYSENDAKIVEELITPFENRWKVYRVSPFSSRKDVIHLTANEFFERLVLELIDTTIYEKWDFLNYRNQKKNIATAVLGYKLTPQDVHVCPELPQVQKAKKILELNNFVILQGKPGSGKSISCYQIAYKYLEKGYEVLRYNNDYFNTETDITIPTNLKAIFIIDDAHLLKDCVLRNLQEKSSENQKIILTITDDIENESALISISNFENIECISKYYLENRFVVMDIISSIDKDIGDYFLQESLESRIELAAKEDNLWTFNYILRGGWKSTKEDYYQIKELNNAQRLIFLLALKQVLTKDNIINLDWLIQNVHKYFPENEISVDQTIIALRKKKLIDPASLRMIHFESAKRQLIFIFDNDKENKKIYEEILRNEILSDDNPLIGKVWFMNGTFSSSINKRIQYLITAEEFSNIITQNLSLKNDLATTHSFYLIDILVRSTSKHYFDLYSFSQMIIEQIEKVNRHTSYALSSLLNELYNTDKNKAKKIGESINVEQVAKKISNLNYENLYNWSRFLSRLCLLLTQKQKLKLMKLLDKSAIENELLKLGHSELDFEQMVEFIDTIYFIDKEYGIQLFNLTLQNFRVAFKRNSIKAWNILGFGFIAYLMGFNSLSEKRTYLKKEQRIVSELIISFIDAKQLAEELLIVPYRSWHNLSELFRILRYIDFPKYSLFVESINLEILKNKFDKDNVWEDFRSEIVEFLYLYFDKKHIAIIDKFLFENKDKLKQKNVFQFAFCPSLIKYHLDNNLDIPLKFSKDYEQRIEWQALDIIVYVLKETDDILLSNFLLRKSKEIANAISNFEEIDLNSINRLLETIHEFDEQIFNEIKNSINVDILKENAMKFSDPIRRHIYNNSETKLKIALLLKTLNDSNPIIELSHMD
ncbi:nSTAND3 domain-containing NTPase [Peribacillus frigoritolerans]|uniref:Novel STAND NTPase 3 domain-containing protein n=1 Tax=Peribacillus castrilensis TaxID=2897690 RepID=A0AAW9N4J9_9BACI|nr:hypothetical protein [Peribacillus castrilensis]MEC0347040.1 hypothetical protein [Peribacillus castrilensis]